MNSTKARLTYETALNLETGNFELPDKVHFTFEADLVREDFELLLESRDYMNQHMQEQSDTGDHMLALLTWAIHRAYEDRTGKPFVLRMDRPKN